MFKLPLDTTAMQKLSGKNIHFTMIIIVNKSASECNYYPVITYLWHLFLIYQSTILCTVTLEEGGDQRSEQV